MANAGHQRRVPDRPPQPEPARRDEPGVLRQPHRRARGGHLRGARPPARGRAARRSSAQPSPTQDGSRSCCSALADRPPLFRDRELRRRARCSSARAGTCSTAASAPVLARGAGRDRRALEEVDRLDVCDARDEAAHGYRYESRLGELAPRRRRAHRTATRAATATARRRRARHPGRRVVPGAHARRARPRGRAAHARRSSARACGSQGGLGASSSRSRRPGILVRDGRDGGARLGCRTGRAGTSTSSGCPRRPCRGTTELALAGRYASFHYWFFQ